MSAILVLGARNLGGAVADRFAGEGWDVATVSLSEGTAAKVRERIPDALAISADAGDPDALEGVVDRVVERFGSLDAAVEAGSGTLVQITGGSARRAMKGKAAWAAGAFATRALAQAAALEYREKGVHVSLLVVDAVIESAKTREALADRPARESASQADVVGAIEYLVGQSERAWTHELTITPRGDRWVP